MFSRLTHLLRLIIFCLCSAFLLSIIASPLAYAHSSSDPITVTAESDSIHFPNYIDFQVSAVDIAHPIVKAIINITYNATQNPFPTMHVITFNHPVERISAQWREDTSKSSDFQLPGTPVQYYWVIQDSSGFQHTQATQSFTTIDTRFSWQHLSTTLLQVNWYNRSAAFGQLLLRDALNALNHIQSNLGGGLRQPVNLWVYASDQDFHGALGPGTYEWVGGEAVPPLREAFISVQDSNDETLVRDMPHELTHLVFHQIIGPEQSVPTWFDEGMAVYNQFYHEPEMKARFEEALLNHSLLRLSQISLEFPADADQAYLAYAESWQLLTYMYSTFGTNKMQRLVNNLSNASLDFDSDVQQTLGEDTLHLENQWLLSLNQPGVLSPDQVTPTPKAASIQTGQGSAASNDTLPALTALGVLLILLPLAGIVIVLVYQSRKRRGTTPVLPASVYNGPVNIPNRPTAPAPGMTGQSAQARYQYIPFYYPATDETAPAPRPPANQPPPPSAPAYQNGATPQDQHDQPPAWGPFSEYADTGKRAPDKQIPQE